MTSPARVIFLVAASSVTLRVRNHSFDFDENAALRCAKRTQFFYAHECGISRRF